MRMWMVDPAVMCNKHLLGEHVEMHMFAGSLRKGRSIEGHVDRGQVVVGWIPFRHDVIAREMNLRGMKHATPLANSHILYGHSPNGSVDFELSLKELASRCKDCKMLQQKNEVKSYDRADRAIQ